MKLNDNNIKLAIQKDGRLTERSIELLKNSGLEFEIYKDRLFAHVRNFNIDVLFLRDDDIPEYVEDGVCELGIVGENIIEEKSAKVKILQTLGFGECKLVVSVANKSSVMSVRDLESKKIATSYGNTLEKYLNSQNINASVIKIRGSVELAPSLGVADAICDIVSTGSTLRTHDLREIATIFNSQAVLITNNNASQEKMNTINQLLMRIRGCLKSRQLKYIMLNAPKSVVPEIKNIIPGLKSPTVVPLADSEMVAIHSVVPEYIFWEVIEKLKSAGASDILVLPIEQMIS